MLYTAQETIQPTDLIEIHRYSYKQAIAIINGFTIEGLLFQNAPLPVMINEIENLGYLYRVIYH